MSERDEQYSNRELDHYFKDIRDTLNRIEAQTTKTNGRVTHVEDEIEDVKVWQGYMKGGLAVITILLIPILFILLQFYLSNGK